MSTKSTKPNGRARKLIAKSTTTTTVVPQPETSTTIVETVETVPAPMAIADVITIPDGMRVPACVSAYVTGFRAIASMPVATTDERITASRAFASAAFPNDEFPAGPTANGTRSDIGTGIMDVQNAVYLAVVLSNVDIHVGHVAASWAAIFPNARCGRKNSDARNVPYVSAKTFDYAFTGTLSAFVNANNGHGGHGGFSPDARMRSTVADMFRANRVGMWYRAPRATQTA